MTSLRRAAFVALAVLAAAGSLAEDPLPPVPRAYLNDYAGVIPDANERALEEKLRLFDEQSSSQIVVAVFPKLPSPSLEDFTIRTAQAWGVGRKELNNGVVLFVFVEDRRLRLEVGYGLEGALPDATANRIEDEVIAPRFRAGDYAGGISAGVDAVMAATRGEYKAAPRAATRRDGGGPDWLTLLIILMVLAFVFRGGGSGGSRTFSRRGGYGGYYGGWVGGGWGGGFGGGGGGGGFSGGGGGFGGGGASGEW